MSENLLVNLHNMADILLQIFYGILLVLNVPFFRIILWLILHGSVQKFRHNFVDRLKWKIGQRPGMLNRFDGFPSGQGMTTGSFLYVLYFDVDIPKWKKIALTGFVLGFLSIRWFTGRHTLIQLLGGLVVGFIQQVFCKFVFRTAV